MTIPWRYVFSLSPTEMWMFAILFFVGAILLLFSSLRRKPKKIKTKDESLPSETLLSKKKEKSKKPNIKVTEIFDYNGIKILHEEGNYLVNDRGVIYNYSTWESLPKRYQSMVLELDQRSQGAKGEDYFLEMINGYYYISEPNGKKKRYDSKAEIPAKIRKAVGLE